MTAAVLQCCSSGSGQGGLRPLVGGRAPRPGAGMTLQGGSLHVDTAAVLQCCSPLWGPRQSLCVSGLLLGHLRHAAVLQCLASVCYHTTAYWSLVCQGITSLCRIFLKFCFLKCPQADLILPLYPQLKTPGQVIYPSPPASLSILPALLCISLFRHQSDCQQADVAVVMSRC